MNMNNDIIENSTEEVTNSYKPSNKTILKVDNFKISFNKGSYYIYTNFGRFDVREGDFMLLKGRNGSGKSTFLKYVTNNFVEGRYSEVNGGVIDYISKDNQTLCPHKTTPENVSFIRREVVEVSQFDDTQSTYSAYDILKDKCESAIRFSKNIDNEKKKELEDKLENLINTIYLGITLPNDDVFSLGKIIGSNNQKEFRRKKISNYSGGQQKLVNVIAGLVKAIIMESNLLLLDEPVNNLDGKNKYYLNQLVQYVRNENPKLAIIMVSHCHIFENINKVVDVDNGNKEHTYVARLIEKESANEIDKLKFIPHSDCIEDCGNLKKSRG